MLEAFVKPREINGRLVQQKIGDINGTLFTYLRSKARERSLDFNISKQYLWDLYEKQNRKCALSGVPIEIASTLVKSGTGKRIDRTNHTASLDRIDNSLPYIEGNLQWVHKKVNGMRRQYSIREYIDWCTLVADYNK